MTFNDLITIANDYGISFRMTYYSAPCIYEFKAMHADVSRQKEVTTDNLEDCIKLIKEVANND